MKLTTELQKAFMIEGKTELVTEKTRDSNMITERNGMLMLRFADGCTQRGLSKFHLVFFFNMFWNMPRIERKTSLA